MIKATSPLSAIPPKKDINYYKKELKKQKDFNQKLEQIIEFLNEIVVENKKIRNALEISNKIKLINTHAPIDDIDKEEGKIITKKLKNKGIKTYEKLEVYTEEDLFNIGLNQIQIEKIKRKMKKRNRKLNKIDKTNFINYPSSFGVV